MHPVGGRRSDGTLARTPRLLSGGVSVVDILHNAVSRTLAGQDHGPADEVLAPVLVEFFKG